MVGNLTFSFALFSFSPSSSLFSDVGERKAKGSEADAIVYTEAGLKGQSQTLSVGRYDMYDLTVPNDSISSVAVRQGVRVTLYEHAGFSGRKAVITADTRAFGGDFDGTTSSIVVEKL